MSIQKRRGGFTARWYGPDKVERSKHFPTKREAEDYLATQRVKVNTGGWTPPEQGRVSLQAWADETWLPTLSHLKPSTRTRYSALARVHVLARFGRVPLDKVSHAEVVAWVSELTAAGLAPSTVRAAHRVLSLMLALAVRDGRLARNAAHKVKLPRARRAEPRFLTRAELERLALAMGAEGDVVRFLGLTGLRYGEMAALRVGAVDLLRRRVRVVEAVAEVAGRLEYGSPKTHQTRTVSLARSLVEALARRCEGKGARDLVFTAPRGGDLRQRAFRVRFDRAAREAGLEDLSPHDLRDTAASLAVSAGANVKVVQRMLGHASAAMTLDVYSGLFDDDLDAVAERMDGPMINKNTDFVRTGADVVSLMEHSTGG